MKLLKTRGTKILSVGGYHTGTDVKIFFSLDDETNVIYPDLPILFDQRCTLKVNNFMCCIGGRTINVYEPNQVFRLNLNESTTDMKWNEMPEMNNKRFDYGAAVYNNNLVVCSG